MSTSSININEVHLRLRREYNSLMAFDIPRLAARYEERREKLKIKNYATYANSFPIRSAAGNNWIIFIQKSPAVKKYINKNCMSILAVTYHYCDKGLRAFYLADNNVIVGFNPHFFERYNERMKLNLTHPLDIVKAFFKKGIYSHVGMIKNKSKQQPIAFRADGLQLGEYHVKDGYMEWRTFISKDLTFPSQHRIGVQLRKQHTEATRHIPALAPPPPAVPYRNSNLVNKFPSFVHTPPNPPMQKDYL